MNYRYRDRFKNRMAMTLNPKKIFIIDNNEDYIQKLKKLLEEAGFIVYSHNDAVSAIPEIIAIKPECTIIDISMPDLMGLEFCQRIRKVKSLDKTKIIAHSAKSYEYDQRRALQFGANEFIPKPYYEGPQFLEAINNIIHDQIDLTFWGVRGTLPNPGPDSIKYGGNTSCVSLKINQKPLIVFDAGSGIRNLGESLQRQDSFHNDTQIFISHPHWDHLNAIPFFSPLYKPGNNIQICGPRNPDITVEKMISDQMSSVYFPITVNELAAHIRYIDLAQGEYEFNGIKVHTFLLQHPGHCLGYKVIYNGYSICYMTDNELYPKEAKNFVQDYNDNLSQFVKGTDILIIDTTYSETEYFSKQGWGHSSVKEVVTLAHNSQVKKLCLFHHDPVQKDKDIDAKLDSAKKQLEDSNSETEVIAPKEGTKIKI